MRPFQEEMRIDFIAEADAAMSLYIAAGRRGTINVSSMRIVAS